MKINFNQPPYTGNEDAYVLASARSEKLSGDGEYGKKCQEWFEKRLRCSKALLTPSCTHALEMAAILLNIKPGDEVIMPSYTFVSTANAFVLRGAKIVFVDIRPDTMNIDESLIEGAITDRTRAIVPVHYAGVACEMNKILQIAKEHGLVIVEDAAQGMMAAYDGKELGTLGNLAAYSFHETKNITSGGEGGLLIVNEKSLSDRAEIIREKGTNRSQFFRGVSDKYTWIDVGSSYLPSEIQAAYLWGQLELSKKITSDRVNTWNKYKAELQHIEDKGDIETPTVPANCKQNGHMFYIKCENLEVRTKLIEYLAMAGIVAPFHYVPLHTSPAGKKFGSFSGVDRYTTKESERLLRLPLYYKMREVDQDRVIDCVRNFFI